MTKLIGTAKDVHSLSQTRKTQQRSVRATLWGEIIEQYWDARKKKYYGIAGQSKCELENKKEKRRFD